MEEFIKDLTEKLAERACEEVMRRNRTLNDMLSVAKQDLEKKDTLLKRQKELLDIANARVHELDAENEKLAEQVDELTQMLGNSKKVQDDLAGKIRALTRDQDKSDTYEEKAEPEVKSEKDYGPFQKRTLYNTPFGVVTIRWVKGK